MTQDTNGHGDAKVPRPAPTLWAQSNDTVFLTFKVEDCKNVEVIFKPELVEFSGQDNRTSVTYSNLLTLFSEIKPEGCTWSRKGFGVECKIQKKTAGFWKRLLKDAIKNHWLKIDFQRWKDEDDSASEEEAAGEPDLSQMMAQMGGGMPGGMMNMEGMDDEEEEDDSDDDEIPELEENTTKQEDTPEA